MEPTVYLVTAYSMLPDSMDKEQFIFNNRQAVIDSIRATFSKIPDSYEIEQYAGNFKVIDKATDRVLIDVQNMKLLERATHL